MLAVEYGPFDRLERAFLGRLRELKAGNPLAPVAIVAPSRRMADRLERLVAVEQGLALLGAHFHTFYSLAMGVLEEAGFPEANFIGDPLFHDRLVDAVLDARPGLGRRFGGEARPRALASALRASVRDLIDAGVDPRELLADLGDWPQESAAVQRLQDLLELQRAYQAASGRLGILSPSGATRAAAEAAEGSSFLGGFKEILYYGFYDLTGLQLEFFDRVTSTFPSVFFFPYRKGHPAWRFCDEFFALKLHHGTRPPRSLEPEGAPGLASDGEPALGPALQALFSPERYARTTDGRLRVFSASGARDEAWSVSKEILRLAEEEDIPFDDIGVVARTLEPYRAAVADAFESDAVPFELAEGEPLRRHPLAKMAIELLTLRRRDFPSAAVSDLVRSPYFRWSGRPEGSGNEKSARKSDARARTPMRRWGRLIERLGISAGWPVWEAKLGKAARAESPETAAVGGLAAEAADLLELLASIRAELEPGGGPKSWRYWSERARGILEERLALPGDAAADESSAWDAVRGAAESLAAFDPLGPIEWNFFLDTLVEQLEAARLEGPSRRGVRVMNAMDARGESFRVLFLIGLQEGLFPRQVREDPILPDEARRRLKDTGGYWIARKGAGHEEERLLFALCVSAARERLYCVYSRSDEDGRARTPSWYLRELCRAAGVDLAAAERVPRQPLARLRTCAPERLCPREAALRLTAAGRDASAFLDDATGGGALLRDLGARSGLLNARGIAGSHDGIVGPQAGILERLLKRGFSPSALDAFGRCPFQYFASHILGLDGEEASAERGELSAALRGRIYHAALERFYRDLSRAGYWKRKGSDWEAMLAESMSAVFGEYGWREVGVYPLVWSAARSVMEEELRRFVRWDLDRIDRTGLVPSFFEAELRGFLPLPAMAGLEGAEGRVEFHGFADRIDLDARTARYQVVDYKTRWGRRRLDQLVYSGRMHQPPIYAELAPAAISAGEKAGRKPWSLDGAHVYVLEAADDGERLQAYSEAQWNEDKAAVLEALAAAVSEIARGRFPIRPDDGEHGHCARCSFPAVCRKSHRRSRERAEAFYEGSALERIHERKRPRKT